MEPGAGLPEEQRRQASTMLEHVYASYHGGLDGLDDLRKASASSIFPAAGFAIDSATTVAARRAEAELSLTNPELAAWLAIRQQLQAAVTLKLTSALPRYTGLESKILFRGTAESFNADPFNLLITADPSDIQSDVAKAPKPTITLGCGRIILNDRSRSDRRRFPMERVPSPTVTEIKEAFTTSGPSPHLCRCGTYTAIIEAVQLAATLMTKGGQIL